MNLFIISERVLARWQHLVAFIKDMELPHWSMRAVLYPRIVMAIKMVSKVDTFCIVVLFAVPLAATGAIRSEQSPDVGL